MGAAANKKLVRENFVLKVRIAEVEREIKDLNEEFEKWTANVKLMEAELNEFKKPVTLEVEVQTPDGIKIIPARNKTEYLESLVKLLISRGPIARLQRDHEDNYPLKSDRYDTAVRN